jgi:hypothetical protein
MSDPTFEPLPLARAALVRLLLLSLAACAGPDVSSTGAPASPPHADSEPALDAPPAGRTAGRVPARQNAPTLPGSDVLFRGSAEAFTPQRTEKGAATTVVVGPATAVVTPMPQDIVGLPPQDAVSLTAHMQFEVPGGGRGMAAATFMGAGAPSLEVRVQLVTGRPASLAGGDVSADTFLLRPLLQAVQSALGAKYPHVEAIGLRLEGLAERAAPAYLQMARATNWKVMPGQLAIAGAAPLPPFRPAPGQDGILPTHRSDTPNFFSLHGKNVLLPRREWTLFYRSGPVQYEYHRPAHAPTRSFLVASTGPRPSAPVTYDLHVAVEEFGGRDRAFATIAQELDADAETPLTRVVLAYLNVHAVTAKGDKRPPPPPATVRVFDRTDPTAPLGEKVFRYLPAPVAVAGAGRSVLSLEHPAMASVRAAEAAQADVAGRVAKLSQDARFAGIPGAVYFAALAAGDFEVLAHLDREHTAPFVKALAVDRDQVLARVMALGGGGSPDAMQAMLLESVRSATLLREILAVYLLAYARTYDKACLGADHRVVEVSRVEQRYLVDRFGTEIPSGSPTKTTYAYPVKAEFYEILRSVALSSTGLAQALDGVMRGKSGGVSMLEARAGTRALMTRFACDSAVILGMERNMREYWAICRERMKAAGSGGQKR